jgi:hypothetical protein
VFNRIYTLALHNLDTVRACTIFEASHDPAGQMLELQADFDELAVEQRVAGARPAHARRQPT